MALPFRESDTDIGRFYDAEKRLVAMQLMPSAGVQSRGEAECTLMPPLRAYPAVVVAFLVALLAYPVTTSAEAVRPAPQSGAGGLAQPDHKQQGDDAMHTAPGRAGKEE